MPKQRKPAGSNSRKRPPAARATKTTAKHTRPKQEPALGTMLPRPSKKASMLDLLRRPEGAAIGELTDATGWQPHSVRAMLTGFRKDGRELVRSKDETGTTRYSLAGEV